MHHYHEIVRVLNGKTLIDPESYECTYFTREGRPRAPGYYIVLWPPEVVTPRYDHQASYIGPFMLELHAKIMARRYEGGYVVENRPATQTVEAMD